MPKSPTERKAAQRDAGVVKVEIHVDAKELEMLKRNCALRGAIRMISTST